ncbi:c-type cytochrome biogenesis protein CcsB [Calidifontimicrobium sp. SYSU G02091]|jgi:cytochrome c-type biogenesis protein CcsB|uniref:c-type cytochrome biogenesis protein CcsB n=1 Tax=Calidifontimicrobium sp. SYSU G02091 TaxID=2926421 RepID=UPI001F538E2A|nr:c-type cytochrome biogenesis protein CcsB [Calidifontimicrobium sp. SYSU G02091]MCI1192508.1 c-type cytochrome biogenesis protein CcsB [Calidifontimicrobium sp. SYSU G02091]
MNTATTSTHRLPVASRPSRLGAFGAYDWLFAALVIAGTGFAFWRYGASMDVYEKWILAGSAPVVIGLGWFWAPLRTLALGVGAAVLLAIGLYARTTDGFGADLAAADNVFLLKYFLSSQSAILWMSVLFFMSTVFYWIGVFATAKAGTDNTAQRIGSRLAWAAVFMALVGSLVRWYESHQIAPDIGHIPVSNLYEVFVLFCWMTALFYLYYEQVYKTKALGAFAMLIVSAAVGFLLWYTVDRQAHEIQPLVPALQSWWMKLHVPANFIGYGTFAIAAMVAFAYLIKQHASETNWWKLAPLWALGVVLCFEPLLFRKSAAGGISNFWAIYFGASALLVGGIIAMRRRIAAGLPSFEVLDDVMYKAIAVGFAFFTIATILGAFWAAEAWGGYWSWDPKETWALIVWLNYAAWLHMRLMKGLRGTISAWWALVGLAVTTFAFLGVNMFLSGLHSYGTL